MGMDAGKLMVYKMSLALAGVLLIAGVLLVAVGTGHATPGRYLISCRFKSSRGFRSCTWAPCFAACGLAKSGPHAMKDLYAWIFQRTSKENAARARNMFLGMTLMLISTPWMLDAAASTPSMYRALQANLAICTALNVLYSLMGALGLYGWQFQIFLPKESRGPAKSAVE
jgi:hypothetical protein